MTNRAKKYVVTFGLSTRTFWTPYHAEQFVRALRLNGTQCKLTIY